jgi:diketogulonate reductase-like aldo/keto reductase
MPDRPQSPGLLYGTAWKEENTERLVTAALAAGFRGVDTANQRRHYHEAAVGAALARLPAGERAALFLQSKFTFAEGQDHRLPYDPGADVETQVRQSFGSSLEHLGAETLSSYLLHGPSESRGLGARDRAAWRALEALRREGRTAAIGVSNVSPEQLALLCDGAEIPPDFVQNRCYARLGWDREVRAVCRAHGVTYQGFSLLTANRYEWASREVRAIAARLAATPAQVIFRFALQIGMVCLTGTTDPAHMREDLGAYGFELSAPEVAAIERLSG